MEELAIRDTQANNELKETLFKLLNYLKAEREKVIGWVVLSWVVS